MVTPTLGVHDGDVRDDGDCGVGEVGQGPDLRPCRPCPTLCLPAPCSLDMGRLGWVARLMASAQAPSLPVASLDCSGMAGTRAGSR